MAEQLRTYWYDRWVEYMALTLAENVASCLMHNQPLAKLRLEYSPGSLLPDCFKGIYSNGLLLQSTHHLLLSPQEANVYRLHTPYQNPCELPQMKDAPDLARDNFVKKALRADPVFYEYAFNFSRADITPQVLQEHGIDLSDDFQVQIFDGKNFMSFYNGTAQAQLKQQLALYFRDNQVFKLLNQLCFYRRENQSWLQGLRS
jgi:hypothetical protein